MDADVFGFHQYQTMGLDLLFGKCGYVTYTSKYQRVYEDESFPGWSIPQMKTIHLWLESISITSRFTPTVLPKLTYKLSEWGSFKKEKGHLDLENGKV